MSPFATRSHSTGPLHIAPSSALDTSTGNIGNSGSITVRCQFPASLAAFVIGAVVLGPANNVTVQQEDSLNA